MSKRMFIAALALGGVFLATYLTLYHYGCVGTLACGTGACERVQQSRWAVFLGLPVALWGTGFYVTVCAVATAGSVGDGPDSPRFSTAILALTAIGVLFSGYLTWAEAFRINDYCRYCLVSAGLTIVLFVLALLDWRESRAGPAA